MKWWKRALFSIISMTGGFISLDYQIYAFSLLTQKQSREAAGDAASLLWQVVGCGMFMVYMIILAGYFHLVRKNVVIFPPDQNDGKMTNWKVPRIEIILQVCFLLTGLILRIAYLLYIYLPDHIAVSK